MAEICSHLNQVDDPPARTPDGCEECLKMGDDWVQLRRCLTCGHVGCCDSSKNKHATKHFRQTQHPIIQAYKEGDAEWLWCYVDQLFMDTPPPRPEEHAQP